MAKNILSDALGQVGSLGKQAVKQVVKLPKDFVETAAAQAGLEKKSSDTSQGGEAPMPQVIRDKNTENFVKGLYGADSQEQSTPQANVPKQNPEDTQQPPSGQNSQKSPEEKAQMENLLQKLHNETYYQPLITRPKKQEEVEKPKERVERLEMEELKKDEEKKKKKDQADISLEREKTKTEKRPGAG